MYLLKSNEVFLKIQIILFKHFDCDLFLIYKEVIPTKNQTIYKFNTYNILR